MAYDLPFLSSSQRKAARLRPQTEEELDPFGATTVPRAPRVWEPDIPSSAPPAATGNRAYTAWLSEHERQNQPIVPASAPIAPRMSMADRISAFEADTPYGESPAALEPSAPIVAAPERPLSRTEVAERYPGGLSPEIEAGLVASGLIEPAAPKTRKNTYDWSEAENRWQAPPMDEITDPGFEEYVRDQWVDYPFTDREGNERMQSIPKPMAQTLAKRGGFGDYQGYPEADIMGALDHVIKPFEVFSETIVETFAQLPKVIRGDFEDIDAPTLFTEGFVAAYEEHRDRPIWQQIILGIVTDPAVMFKAVTLSAKLAKAGTAAARRAEYIPIIDLFRTQIAHAAPQMSDDAADELARSLASKMDEVIAATPEGMRQSKLPWATEEGSFTRWQEFLGRGEDMGQFARTPLSEKRAQLRVLRDEYQLSLDGGANEFAAPLRNLDAVVEEVVTKEGNGLMGKAYKVVGSIVGPSLTRSTPVGKIVTAYGRQVRSANELIKVSMASAYDRHIDQFDELKPIKDRVVPVNSKGEWVDSGTGKVVAPWQTVFEKPDQYSQFITPKARKLIDDVNQMTNDEVARFLDDEGITQRVRARPENEYYVPHRVEEIRGIDVTDEAMNASLRRHYEDVSEGMAAGIKYGSNPRQDIELYMRWAYRQVTKKQLNDALEVHGMTRSQLVPKHLDDALVAAASEHSSLLKQSKSLKGAIRLATATANTLTRTGRQQEGHRAKLDSELVRLRGLLDYLPDLVRIGDAPGRQELEAAERGVRSALRLQDATQKAVGSARSAVAETTGKLSARTDELRRLDTNYDRLVSTRDDMVQSSRAYTGDQPPVLASEIRQQDLAQSRFRTLGVEETRARRAAVSATGRVESVTERRNELSKLADLVEDDLQVARELTSEALARLRYATSQAGIEQSQRGVVRGKATTLNQEIERLITRLESASRRVAKTHEKESAQRAVLQFLKGQQDSLTGTNGRIAKSEKTLKSARSARNEKLTEIKHDATSPGAFWGPNQPNEIPVKVWRNRFFPKQDVELLNKVINTGGREGNWFTRGVVSLVNLKRSLAATGDAAQPFIQGLPVMAANPKAWGEQTARHYQAFFDPTVQSRRISANLADYQWLARNGVPIGDLEFFAALESGEGVSFARLFGILPKGDAVQRYFRTAGKQSFGRFGAMYNTALGEARVQLLQSARVGWKGTDAELAQYIRNLTGGLDARALGVGPGRTAAEGFWLAFSPRLLRSTVALVGDAIQGGVPLELVPKALEPVSPRLSRGMRTKLLRGKEVDPVYDVDIDLAGGVRQDVQREIVGGYSSTAQGRRSLRTLATLAGGVTTTYIVTGMALGKDWNEIKEGLNPLNGKRFLSHQINGDWIGVGGQIRALFQMMAAIAVDPTSLTETTRRDNPILAFLSGRGAIGTQAVAQTAEAVITAEKLGFGGDADIDPFERIDSWTDLGKAQGKGHVPFVLQGMMEGEKWPTSVASALGLRTSEWNEYDGLRDNKGVRTEQLQEFVQQTNIAPGGTIQVEWEGETLEFDLAEDIVEFGDLQPREQLLFKAMYPSTFEKENQLVRDLAKSRNAPDWAIKRVEGWDLENGFVMAQEDSDRQLTNETLGVKEWKDGYRRRKFDAMKNRQALYDYDKGEIEEPLDVFYAKLEEIMTVTDPDTGESTVDAVMTEERWRELDVWLSQQPEQFKIYVDNNTGLSSPTEKTQDFDYGTRVISERYWGPTDPVTGSILNFPAEHSQGNVPIWSKTGTEFLDITPDEARIYKEHMTYPKGDPRTRRVTVLADEIGTPVEGEKKALKAIVNYVEGQLSGFRKNIIWTDEEVRRYVWTYYNTSEESVFIQDYLTRLAK